MKKICTRIIGNLNSLHYNLNFSDSNQKKKNQKNEQQIRTRKRGCMYNKKWFITILRKNFSYIFSFFKFDYKISTIRFMMR